MIQRIQSIYLLLVVFLSGLLFCFNLATFENATQEICFSLVGIENVITAWPLIILNLVVLAIALLSIFKYNNRNLQKRLCTFNILLSIGLYALIAYYIYVAKGDNIMSIKFPIVIPFINIILTYMALRGIKHDEELLRSADRLR